MLILLGNSLAPTLREYFTGKAQSTDGYDRLPASFGKFTAGQSFTEHFNPVKGQPVILVQSLGSIPSHSTNDFAMQALFEVAELKRRGASAVWVIAPYAGYSRQDRAVDGRYVSQGMDTYAKLLKAAGADGFSTIHMHSDAGTEAVERHFGKEQVFNLSTAGIFADYIRGNLNVENLAIGGPDAGAHDFAADIARLTGASGFGFTKRHIGVSDTETTGFEGDVSGKTTLTADDEIDTGGTITNAQKGLKAKGAIMRLIGASHAVFSNGGLERVFTAGARDQRLADTVVTTDTIDRTHELAELARQYGDLDDMSRVVVLPVGPLLWEHVTKDIAPHPVMTAEAG